MKTNRNSDSDSLGHTGREPHLLREIVRTHQVLMSGFSREVGMPASRLALMRTLANALRGEIGIMELARSLGINAAAVTRQIQEMEKAGLIIRRPDPRDGRRTHVRLSAKGLSLFKKIHDRSHEMENSLSRCISAEEMTVAADVLVRLREFLEKMEVQRHAGKSKGV